MSGIAGAKAQGRQQLHERLAVSAVYTKGPTEIADDPAGLRFTVRWHNKLSKVGEMEGGFDATIIEGINRLVFNELQLLALGLDPKTLGGATVEVPELRAKFMLDSMEPMDGPVNVYWQVARIGAD